MTLIFFSLLFLPSCFQFSLTLQSPFSLTFSRLFFPFCSLLFFFIRFHYFYYFYFITHTVCSHLFPPFYHSLNILRISPGSLTIPFITSLMQHYTACSFFPDCLKPAPGTPPHMHIFLRMFLVALGWGWDKEFFPHYHEDLETHVICRPFKCGSLQGPLSSLWIVTDHILTDPYYPIIRTWCLSWMYETRLLSATSLWFWDCAYVRENSLVCPCLFTFIQYKN